MGGIRMRKEGEDQKATANFDKSALQRRNQVNEKKRIEFEHLLQEQQAERENLKVKKQQNTEQNKDPKELATVIQRNFREKYDTITKEVEEFKEGNNIDNLFSSFNELKDYFVNTSYSLTPYDKQQYKEQLEKT